MALICADTNFFYAVYDPAEALHLSAFRLFLRLFELPAVNALAVPWPILYETLDTRLARRPESITRMNEHFTRLQLNNRLALIDDQPFRDYELAGFFSEVSRGGRPISLVDRIVRRLIATHLPRIEVLVSRDEGHFSDVCFSSGCRIMSF